MPERHYPAAERTGCQDDLHGCRVADPYRWLEDARSPQTEEWSAAQDALFGEQAQRWDGRARFAADVRELLGAGFVGAPSWRGERCLFMRRAGEQEHGVLYTASPAPAAPPSSAR